MTTQEVIVVFSVIEIINLLAAVLLWKLPGPCVCGQCPVHVRERADKAEAARVKRHRQVHDSFDIPWGDKRCGGCRQGNERDRER